MIRVPTAWLDWLTVPRSLAIVASVGGGYALLVWSAHRDADSLTGVLSALLAPLVAFVIAAPLVALIWRYVGWTKERTLAPWQGHYYAFDDHQIRVLEVRGGLWFPYADVCGALDLKPKAHLLRTLRSVEHLLDEALGDTLSMAGLTVLFGRSSDRTTLRFLHWAEHDVCVPWRNKRDHVAVDQAAGSLWPPSAVAPPRDAPPPG